MEYETEEQQVEALKAWWADNSRAVIAGIVLGVGVIGSWTLWQGYSERKTVSAGDTYSRVITASRDADEETVLSLADEVQDDNPGHLYASYAQLAAALAAVEKDDLADAEKRLKWVAENAPQEDVQLIAQVRLARVKGAMGETSAALALLPTSFPDSFIGIVEEVRGDLSMLDSDVAAARKAYKAALESEYVGNREGLTMKLNELAEPGDMDEDATESSS